MPRCLPQSSGRRHTMARAWAGSSAQEAAALAAEPALARRQPSRSSWQQQSMRRRRFARPDASYAYGTPLVLFTLDEEGKRSRLPVKAFDLTDGILYHAR